MSGQELYTFHIRHGVSRRIMDMLPTPLRRLVKRSTSGVVMKVLLWRTKRIPTMILGPRWERSRDSVEIDITYVCNMRCLDCNRSCTQDPTSDRMSVEQVEHFLNESRSRQIKWKRIRLLGGEPTCHPQLGEIADLVLRYRDEFSPETLVGIATNGHGVRTNRILGTLPPGLSVKNSSKESGIQAHHTTFNIAPIDVTDYAGSDFSNGCPVTQVCGLGVSPYGYYPCAVAGAIDRTFGFDLGRKTLPADDDDMREELRRFCSLCGLFKVDAGRTVEGPAMSPTWVQAYADSRRNPRLLSRLADDSLH